MRKPKIIIALACVLVLLFSGAACSKSKFQYKDQTDRPEISAPITRPQVVYPDYPDTKPTAPAPGTVPSIGKYSSSPTDNPYELKTEADGTLISYADVTDYSYIYVPVENYSPEYGNIKITFENLKPAAERVAVQAVYYEAKELGYTPVTVLVETLVDGEQYLVSELGEWHLTDDAYNTLTDKVIREQTIIGFAIFIDSLPSFMPQGDTIGTCKIKNFEFLRDDDPKLQDRYVVPDASLENATADNGITLTHGETLTATASEAGTVYLPVSRYSSDFGKYTLTASGTGNVEIGVCFKLANEKVKRYSAAKSLTLSSESESAVYDFADQFVPDESDDIKTQYVRGGTVTDVYIKLPASASMTVRSADFERTVKDGPYVSNVWKGCSGVDVVRVVAGGNAKLAVEHYTDWLASTLSVKKGKGVQKIVYKIYAPQGLNHIGFVVSTTSALGTSGQNPGDYVLRGSALRVNENSSTPSASFTEIENLKGVTETIKYDTQTKIYTFTYDFTNMSKDKDDKTFADYTINSLKFFLNDPLESDVYDDVRNLYFLNIELLTE